MSDTQAFLIALGLVVALVAVLWLAAKLIDHE